MTTNKKNELEKNDSGLILISVIVLILIIGIWLVNLCLLKDLDPVKRGTFGDMFGSINALFSGLAFTGIILTILLQRKELALQRQELKDTREELKRAATAQENSEHSLRRQAENLKISAKLTALNTLVTYYSDLEKSLISAYANKGIPEAAMKRDQYVKRIEEILETKEKS
jgi:hypothetical protein